MTLAQLPRTSTPIPAEVTVLRPRDPLIVAADLLHAAARLPFRMSDVFRWRTDFGTNVRQAAASLDTHCGECSDVDATLSAVQEQPRLLSGVTKQLCEHSHLREACRALEATTTTVRDTEGAIDLMDRSLRLEDEIRKHYGRLVDLVFESVNRELGGSG